MLLVLKASRQGVRSSLPLLPVPFAMVSLPPEIVRQENVDCSPKSFRDLLVQSNKEMIQEMLAAAASGQTSRPHAASKLRLLLLGASMTWPPPWPTRCWPAVRIWRAT